MKYQQQSIVSGGWAKGSELRDGQRAKIVSEVKPSPSQFKDEKTGEMKMQNIGKVQFDGQKEALNVSINRTTLNGLVSAFGEESKNWIGKPLTVIIKEVEVSGKVRDSIYLIPEGFTLSRDSNGYRVIIPIKSQEDDIPVIDTDNRIKEDDLPF